MGLEKVGVAGVLLAFVSSPGLCQPDRYEPDGYEEYVRLVRHNSVAELVSAVKDECSSGSDCTPKLRHRSAMRLAREKPELFLEIAEDAYRQTAKSKITSSIIEDLYWRVRVWQSPSEERETLLWDLYEGAVEGEIPAGSLLRDFAVDQLCEEGSHERLRELREHLSVGRSSVGRVTRDVTHCRDRYQAAQKFGSVWDAAIAMLEGNATASIAKTRIWALDRTKQSLNRLSAEQRTRVENALISAARRWKKQESFDTAFPYSISYWLLVHEFQWHPLQLKDSGLPPPLSEP